MTNIWVLRSWQVVMCRQVDIQRRAQRQHGSARVLARRRPRSSPPRRVCATGFGKPVSTQDNKSCVQEGSRGKVGAVEDPFLEGPAKIRDRAVGIAEVHVLVATGQEGAV